MQDEVIMIDGIVIHQPDKDLQHSFVTTYSEDSVRVQSGVGHFTPLLQLSRKAIQLQMFRQRRYQRFYN